MEINMLTLFNYSHVKGILLWVLKRQDNQFGELLYKLDVMCQQCFDVNNIGQINIPKSIEQVLNGDIVQMLVTINAL